MRLTVAIGLTGGSLKFSRSSTVYSQEEQEVWCRTVSTSSDDRIFVSMPAADIALTPPYGTKRVWIVIGGFEHPIFYPEVTPLLVGL